MPLFKFKPKSTRPSILQTLGISKITPTPLKTILSSRNPIKATVEYGKTVLFGRDNFPPDARKTIDQFGNEQIKSITIIRQPVQSFINKVFNALSFGQFQKKLDELPYDKLFHLRMVITLTSGKQIQVEKNEVINISTNITKHSKQEGVEVPVSRTLTLNDLLKGGQEKLKDKFFSYRAFDNNCQDFVMALLDGSNLPHLSLRTLLSRM